jgi:hypothetical protein
MAEKYLKVIQNGVASFIPDNRRNRDFWTKQNAKVTRSRSSHQEIVTIMEARPEEVAFMQQSGAPSNVFQPVIQTPSEVSELKALLAKQQAQIDRLMQSQTDKEQETIDDDDPEFVYLEAEGKKAKKPGRPPKN